MRIAASTPIASSPGELPCSITFAPHEVDCVIRPTRAHSLRHGAAIAVVVTVARGWGIMSRGLNGTPCPRYARVVNADMQVGEPTHVADVAEHLRMMQLSIDKYRHHRPRGHAPVFGARSLHR